MKQNKYLSKCCNAEVVTANSGLAGETNYYICTKCHNDCDVIPNQNNDREEFGADLHDKFHNICQIRVIEGGHQDVEIEKEVADFCWSWIETHTQKKVEEAYKKGVKDSIKTLETFEGDSAILEEAYYNELIFNATKKLRKLSLHK